MSLPGGRAASAPLLGHETEPTIFELSVPGRSAYQLRTTDVPAVALSDFIPGEHLKSKSVALAEAMESPMRR